MGHRKRLAIALATIAVLAFAAGCAGTPSGGTGNLHVLVLGADNGPLAGAKVISNEQPAGQLKVTGSTGSDGAVTYQNIKAGEYEFYISRFDYEQTEFTVTVKAGETADLTITLNRTPAPSGTAQ